MRRGNRNNLLTFVILKQFNQKDTKNNFLQFNLNDKFCGFYIVLNLKLPNFQKSCNKEEN